MFVTVAGLSCICALANLTLLTIVVRMALLRVGTVRIEMAALFLCGLLSCIGATAALIECTWREPTLYVLLGVDEAVAATSMLMAMAVFTSMIPYTSEDHGSSYVPLEHRLRR